MRNQRTGWSWSLVLILPLASCPGSGGSDGGTTTSDGGNSSSTTGMAMVTTGAISGASAATTDGGMADTAAFDESDSGPEPMGECLLEENDCDPGRKCMPWSLEDDRIPDETRCCAEQDNPDLVGEPCEAQDYDGSCLDSCAAGSMCLIDNNEGLTGVCREFCDPANSQCNADETCKSFFELLPGSLTVPLCMDKCDPVVQDCVQPGWQCIPDTPTSAGQSGFICVPPPPDEPASLFDTCALANDCGEGLVCLTADRVPGCTFLSCCSAYCSVSDGDAECQALHPDFQCVDWMSPDPQWSDVGACAVPA